MSKRGKISILVTLLLLFHNAYCDLPVHCLKHQILGKWTLSITEPTVYKNQHENNCGHSEPDDPNTSYLSDADSFKAYKRTDVELDRNDNVVRDGEIVGTWTMIYDEGFEIKIGHRRYTTFFYYEPHGKKSYISNCRLTTVGWYRNSKTDESACFKAKKILGPNEDPDSYITVDDKIPDIQPLMLVQVESKSLRGLSSLDINKEFKEHQKVVERLNKIPYKTWTAKVPSTFEGKSVKELNSLAGRKSVKQKNSLGNVINLSEKKKEDLSDLPKNFNWTHTIGPIRNQANCGSCYIFATTNMLSARLKIKYDETVLLSVQHPLDCSYYNQGCEGGYPMLVNKFANDFELVPESCHPYVGPNGKCSNSCDIKELDKIYKVKDYEYLGGAFGRSNERLMMEELYKNGPFVVSFEPTYDFMYYSHGIYHSVHQTEWVRENEKKPEWEKVDHSVLLYGWGEENGEKYWILKNTWGIEWGENGSFRMRRGFDESAIESMGEVGTPYIVPRCGSDAHKKLKTDECY